MTNRIFESVDIDWGSRDVFGDGVSAVASCSGVAYLSEAFAAPEDNALLFNYCEGAGPAWIDWVSDLPAKVALGPERLEAALLCLIKETYGDDHARR